MHPYPLNSLIEIMTGVNPSGSSRPQPKIQHLLLVRTQGDEIFCFMGAYTTMSEFWSVDFPTPEASGTLSVKIPQKEGRISEPGWNKQDV